MAITKEGRELMSSIIKLGDTGSETSARQGMKTTNVPGYPIILAWARWGGYEPNSSGNNKAFLFVPYINMGQMINFKAGNQKWWISWIVINIGYCLSCRNFIQLFAIFAPIILSYHEKTKDQKPTILEKKNFYYFYPVHLAGLAALKTIL